MKASSMSAPWWSWWFYFRWTKRVRFAYQKAFADKGYVSVGDHEYIRKGTHWALSERWHEGVFLDRHRRK